MVLALPVAASAQNGFPAPKAAVDQYDPPPPPPQGQGNGQGQGQGSGNGNRPNRGSESGGAGNNAGDLRSCNRRGQARAAQTRRCPAGGAGPDSASGDAGGAGGVRAEFGGTLPFKDGADGRLPFTGLDLLMVASLAALLLALGFALRAVTRLRANH